MATIFMNGNGMNDMKKTERRHARPYYKQKDLDDALAIVGGFSFIVGCVAGASLTLFLMGC